MNKKQKTTLPKDVKQKWYHIDADEQVVGRLAVVIANLLRGRGKTIYTPHMDTGDYVVVTNVDKIMFTGKKEKKKEYMFYSGYRGNERYETVEKMREKKPEYILWHAVKGMLPRNRMRDQLMKKLRLFSGSEHTHEAQNPEAYVIKEI